jgi:hypothetical protein
MLIVLLPITTICVAILGFYVWHRQLTRKRLFEVADAALSAFNRAEAALAYARNPANFVHEGKTRKREHTELPAQSELLDALFIPVERLTQHSAAFDALEQAAFDVEVHFGDEVAHLVREPLRTYNRIVLATTCRIGLVGMSGAIPDRLRQKLEAVAHSVNASDEAADAEADQLSDQIAKAKLELETALRPSLAAPTFGEFLHLGELLSSTRLHVAKLVPLRRQHPPRGYGKIAVYAQLPLTNGPQLHEPRA